jgi:Protein of unknown function (DUF4058)
MAMPFPGMDPYLEHPILWPSVHMRLIVALANQLRPRVRPRYVASVEERVFIEGPDEQRIPDVWIQKARSKGHGPMPGIATAAAAPLVVEVNELEVREPYIAIMDRYRDFKVVTVIEVVSPANKAAGPGLDSYQAKQREIRASECHMVEIDLMRHGRHVMSVPESHLAPAKPFEYLICINRWPARNRFEIYPCRLSDPLPVIDIPLAEPDSDVTLSIQSALEQVYDEGDYVLRVRYNQPCVPSLPSKDQEWATENWSAYRRAYPELLLDENTG